MIHPGKWHDPLSLTLSQEGLRMENALYPAKGSPLRVSLRSERGGAPLRVVSVRETAWLNALPEKVWSHLTDLASWQDWCQAVQVSGPGDLRDLTPGANWKLDWDLRPPAPLRGGTIAMMKDPEEVRFRKVGQLLSFKGHSWSSIRNEQGASDRDSGKDCYQLVWTSGWGPFRSDACISLGHDASGTWVEFLVSWQGWSAWLAGLSRGKTHALCAECQRKWLADLQISMERIGSYG